MHATLLAESDQAGPCLLYTSTRADKFKLWNKNSRVDTPVLDEFSKKATRFAVTYSQGNESRVSHASLFTGLYPATHKFISDKAVLPDSFTIIPEVMKQAGLYTCLLYTSRCV